MSNPNNPFNNVPPYNNPYMNSGFYTEPQMFGQQPNINIENALTNEEIQRIMNTRPNSDVLNLHVSDEDVLRAMCTHRYHGRDVVQIVGDGTNDVYCPICGARWSQEAYSKEEVKSAVNVVLSMMQNAKWMAGFPQNVTREYFTMMPLLAKFPDMYEYGDKNFQRYLNNRGIYAGSDTSVYNQYNSLFGAGFGYGGNPYQPPQQPYNYYNSNGIIMGQPDPRMVPQQQAPVGNPYTNPMQAPGVTVPGFTAPQQPQQAPAQPPQQQYYNAPVNNGPGPQQQSYVPNFGVAQPQVNQQNVAPQPQQQPQAPAQPQQQATATPAEGTPVTYETKIDL